MNTNHHILAADAAEDAAQSFLEQHGLLIATRTARHFGPIDLVAVPTADIEEVLGIDADVVIATGLHDRFHDDCVTSMPEAYLAAGAGQFGIVQDACNRIFVMAMPDKARFTELKHRAADLRADAENMEFA